MADGATADADDGATGSYAGLPGAFRAAFGRTSSYLCKLYAVASAVLGVFVALLLVAGLVQWMANPVGLVGERALLGVVAILVLVPLFAPVLLVARHHRRAGNDPRYDRALAAAGFLFVLSLYAGLVASVPPGMREDPSGLLAPVVAWLYALPASYALLPPAVGALLVAVAHYLAR